MQSRPKARTEGLSAERVADELVIYDQASQMGHCLSAAAASVWERCDGNLSPADIAQALTLEPTVVERAVGELRGAGLLDDGPGPGGGYSRREAAVKIARVGGAAFMAPLIYSVAIAPATAAASACITTGNPESFCTAATGGHKIADARCCSGECYNGSTGKICVSATCVLAGGFCSSGASCCSGKCSFPSCQV